ncbi:MAG: flagellar motor switch protein FliM [Phycisphaerae bacterium]|nr:flagellar motor switch protein FliM [Phycisphaerae bacterium]
MMADVLDQDEVDALLNAVAGGDLESSDEDQDGSDGQMAGAAQSATPVQLDVHTYDFKRPERVSKDQMRALEGLHETFARNFGALLSGYLRTIIEVKVRSTEQLTYAEFTYSLPTPTSFSLMSCEPMEGQICMEISPLIIYPVIDRMLGGGNAELYIPQRPLTQIEQRLANRIIDRAIDALADAWQNIIEAKFEVIQQESNPQLVQIVAPNEVVVVIGFEVKMGNRSGSMSLCFPFAVIEPVMSRLTSQDWFNYRKKEIVGDNRNYLVENLGEAKLHTRCYLGRTTIKVSELLNLEVGDVLKLNKEAKSDLIMQIEGKSKFAGKIGQFKGSRAFRVTRKSKPGEKI